MTTVPVRTGTDTWVNSDTPSAPGHGDGKRIRVQDDGVTIKHGMIHFARPFPRGATILDAHLLLYGAGNWGATESVSVQPLDARFSESDVTYDTEPGVTGTAVTVTQANPADGTEWDFDVTTIQAAISAGAANPGLRISSTSDTERAFFSLNALDFRPVLVVTYSEAPDQPTELTPSAGSAVSVAKPTFTFNFHDVTGETDISALRLQITATNTGWTSDAATGGYATPDFDTETDSPGGVPTSDPEYDSTTGSFAGITAGQTKYWTVQVQNAAGLWGKWSDPARFTRIAKGSVSIDNPAVAPNNYVTDNTPELIHTLTGGTQLARRYVIADDSDPTHPLLDTGRVTTASDHFTLPEGIITDEAASYRETLWVWDDVSRVQTPGDTVHIQAVRVFTFQEDPTPDPVTGLVAAQVVSGRPRVGLDFDRATVPDWFVIWRDGKHIATVDPAEILVSAGHYRWVDHGAAPHTLHTWKVRPKVNGAQGPNDSVQFSYEVPEIWLLDRETDKLVPIVPDVDRCSFSMPEIAGVYRTVDGKFAIRITQAKAGLEGTIAGHIEDRNGDTADNWRANLLWMLRRPENVLRMTIGGQNLPVVLDSMLIAPRIGANPGDRDVSFGFTAQVGPR